MVLMMSCIFQCSCNIFILYLDELIRNMFFTFSFIFGEVLGYNVSQGKGPKDKCETYPGNFPPKGF